MAPQSYTKSQVENISNYLLYDFWNWSNEPSYEVMSNEITYTIDSIFSATQRALIIDAIDEWKKLRACTIIHFRDTNALTSVGSWRV